MFETFPLPPHALDTFQCGSHLDASKFRRLHIWGSGTCFFHSVACLLVYKNIVHQDSVNYYLAIPTNKNLVAVGEKVSTTTQQTTVDLCFSTPNRYATHKFYHNFEQVGIQLRQYLSQTITQAKFEQFKDQAFSSDMKWALSDKIPDWIDVKKQMAEPSKWANIWVVKYAAWALALNLLFINGTSREEPLFCGIENFENGPWTLFIFWSGKVHFEPIVQIRDTISDPPSSTPDLETLEIATRVFSTKHPFINCLRSRFESNENGGCQISTTGKVS
jgi:hypothetical protein